MRTSAENGLHFAVRSGGVPVLQTFLPIRSGFQRREEAFHCGVVPHVSGMAHRTVDAIVGDQPLKLLARALAAPDALLFVKWRFEWR